MRIIDFKTEEQYIILVRFEGKGEYICDLKKMEIYHQLLEMNGLFEKGKITKDQKGIEWKSGLRISSDELLNIGEKIEVNYMTGENVSILQEALSYQVKQPGYYTYEDYYALPEDVRSELIDGYFYDMAAPDTIHQQIILEMAYQIQGSIKKHKGKCSVFIAPTDVRLDGKKDTMLQPDLFILCDKNKITKKNVVGAPDFILEVLSKSTKTKDMYVKSGKYRSAGVREYWMIDPEKKNLIRYFFEKSDTPIISGLEGQAEIEIYDGESKIDLDEILDLIDSGKELY